ncbi:RNA-guided endonuclease InsQ/TnpB family protein [Nostoc sp.]|uniref:RNA-guided endonuclease InsQ/TnpB family protein n=1 Tax=Nostoc sp. TaxID=1180 RepID=UPI002FF6A5B9
MLVFEAKLDGQDSQYRLLDEAIRTARFVRNACVRYWMDNKGIGRYELSAYCAVLANNIEFPWVSNLNSMARQASAERAWVVRRADGYYCQFCIDQERVERREPTGFTIGIDVGLNHFYTDSNGEIVANPRHLRKSEKSLRRLQRRMSRTKKGSQNRVKFRNKLSSKHLKVSRQRKDFVVKTARCVVKSNDLVAYEDLQVRNMVKNHRLAKSISDVSWSLFRQWVEYFGKVFGVVTVAVPPHYTSQNCSNCGQVVKKTLSTRTHVCPHCGHIQDRDRDQLHL